MGQSYLIIGSEIQMSEETKQHKDSSSVDNMQAMGMKAKEAASFLRSTALGNQNSGGRPVGK